MKEEYLKGVDRLIEVLKAGSEKKGDQWEDVEEFRNFFVDNYDNFSSFIDVMINNDGFSMDEAVMFIYGYSMGRNSVLEPMTSNMSDDIGTIH